MTETDQIRPAEDTVAVMAQVPESLVGMMKDHVESEDQDQTEDEEVKRNCIVGFSGLRDSDFSDTDMDDEDADPAEEQEDRDDPMEEEGQRANLVQFVCGSQMTKPEGTTLFRPTPIVPKLATHPEESGEDASSSESEEENEW